MWAYIVRRVLYNIPVYLGIVLFIMVALRTTDPVYAALGKNPTQQEIEAKEAEYGLDKPFVQQYGGFLWRMVRLDFSEKAWQREETVGAVLKKAIPPTLAITVPALAITAVISITVGLIASFYRGRVADRLLVFIAVLGMSISFLVYVIFGQYWGAFLPKERLGLDLFAVSVTADAGDEWWFFLTPENWVYYCLLPVMINVIVAMGYDTRFYRSVMVEESTRDYITTAVAKGANRRKVMFVHMLKNAMIPIITRIMITLPFLITGSILLEFYFGIPGMGKTLIDAIKDKDFALIQTFTAIFAALFIASVILTDVLYALVDPRVRLS